MNTDVPPGFTYGPPSIGGRYFTITRSAESPSWSPKHLEQGYYAYWSVQDGQAWYRHDHRNEAEQRYSSRPREDHFTSGNWVGSADHVAHRPLEKP